MLSLVSVVANYVFNKALGEKKSLVVKYTVYKPAVVRVCLVKSAVFFSVGNFTNIYGSRTEPALTVGQTAGSESEPWNIRYFYSQYSW